MKITSNNKREEESKNEFRRIFSPWQSVKPEQDTGIDLWVQPFITNSNTNEDIPLERMFQVQVKSTADLTHKLKDGGLSYQIDLEHLVQWKSFETIVMLAVYYIPDACFYYIWIDDSFILPTVANPTLRLYKKFSYSERDAIKLDVIKYLLPPKMSMHYDKITENSLKIEPTAVLSFKHKIDEKELDYYTQKALEKINVIKAIAELKNILFNEQKNIKARLQIAWLYARIEENIPAKDELLLLINNLKSVEAKIILNMLNKNAIKNIDKIVFVTYAKWGIQFPTTQVLSFIVLIDNQEFELVYNPNGVLLPIQNFKTLSFTILYNDVCKNLKGECVDFYLFKTSKNIATSEILYEFEEIIDNPMIIEL
jgi:hypothetical protein